jgi:hypothetical protein
VVSSDDDAGAIVHRHLKDSGLFGAGAGECKQLKV